MHLRTSYLFTLVLVAGFSVLYSLQGSLPQGVEQTIVSQTVMSRSQTAAVEGAGSGLVGWYKFDEGSGTTAMDSSGGGNTATLVNNPSWVSGISGQALNFTYGSTGMSVRSPVSVSSYPVSVCSWVKPNLVTSSAYVRQNIIASLWLEFRISSADGQHSLTLYNNNQGITTSPIMQSNTWQHVCATISNTNDAKIYLNGVVQISGNVSNGYFGGTYTIGNADISSVNAFNGAIDDVRIYNRELSISEIQEIYNNSGDTNPVNDTNAPIISGIQATNIGATSASIVWTTNEGASSQVKYGPSTPYGIQSSIDSSMVTSHGVYLSGLTANTTYHYQVLSSDSSGNPAVSLDQKFTTSSNTSSGVLFPADRIANWVPGVNVGVPGGIDQYINGRTSLIDVTKSPYLADNTGSRDSSGAINSAIRAAQSGQVVYLPAGTYLINNNIMFDYKDNITLRGEGPDKTILKSVQPEGGVVVYIGGGDDYEWKASKTSIAGAVKGSSQITLSNATPFQVGDFIYIDMENDFSLPVVSVGGWPRLRNQHAKVVGKSGNTLTISPPLYYDFPASLSPMVSRAQYGPAEFDGVESLKIDMTNTQAYYGMRIQDAYASWVYNVVITMSSSWLLDESHCLRCEVKHSSFLIRAGDGSNGAGIIYNDNTAGLVEDNIIYKFSSLIQVNDSSVGNAFLYNFGNENILTGVWGPGLKSNHDPHNSFNLYEGNIMPNFQNDGYFGGASHDTLFRNWFYTTDSKEAGWYSINLNRFSRYYNVVGNVLGTLAQVYSGPSRSDGQLLLGYPNLGNGNWIGTAEPSKGDYWTDWNALITAAPGAGPTSDCCQEKDLDVANTTKLAMNYYVSGTNGSIPAAEQTTQTVPNSLAYSSKPAWWPTSFMWPPINSSNPTFSASILPAGYRFLNGVNTPPPPPADTTAPTVSITSPSSGFTVSGNVTIQATASDNVGVVGVEFWDGNILLGDDTSPSYSYAWNTIPASNGLHTLKAVARDLAGNRATSTVTITVSNVAQDLPDTTAPTIPSNLTGSAVSQAQVNLSWGASTDPVISGAVTSGLVGYKVYRNGLFVTNVTGSLTFQNNSDLTPNTTYTYQVSAYDRAIPANESAKSNQITVTTPLAPSTGIQIGDRVTTTAKLKVRETASNKGTMLGSQPRGSQGTVKSGPAYANGYTWWNIDYDTGADGWSAGNWLVEVQ